MKHTVNSRRCWLLDTGVNPDRGGGEPLPDVIRRRMESVFDADFSGVRVHVGREASSIGALAFTRGADVFFAEGHYEPHTPHGRQLLAHELTHVLQQRAGRVRNPFGSGVAMVQDDELEAEADRMSLLASADAHPAPALGLPVTVSSLIEGNAIGSASDSVVQCAFVGELAIKTFEYFKKEVAMTYKEYGELNKSAVMYSSLEAVTQALQSLRAAQPSVLPAKPVVAPAPADPALSIPSSWTSTLGPLQLYRAVDLTPGRMKLKGRFSPRTNPKLALPGAIKQLLADPRGFVEGHVRANYDYVHSAATNESCAGYQSIREYVYRINLPSMYRYAPPSGGSNISRPPIIWADTSDRTLSDATKVAFDPRKGTAEVDLIFDIEISMIDQYKRKGTSNWVVIDWGSVLAEL